MAWSSRSDSEVVWETGALMAVGIRARIAPTGWLLAICLAYMMMGMRTYIVITVRPCSNECFDPDKPSSAGWREGIRRTVIALVHNRTFRTLEQELDRPNSAGTSKKGRNAD